jgi:hypothetical protein
LVPFLVLGVRRSAESNRVRPMSRYPPLAPQLTRMGHHVPCATLSMLTYYRTSRSSHFPFGAVCSLSGARPEIWSGHRLEPTSTWDGFSVVRCFPSNSFHVDPPSESPTLRRVKGPRAPLARSTWIYGRTILYTTSFRVSPSPLPYVTVPGPAPAALTGLPVILAILEATMKCHYIVLDTVCHPGPAARDRDRGRGCPWKRGSLSSS